ncbi:MAG: hypothetical protein IPN68_15925 [Bacteroidetes bacterium]|nr:hypothetical protein [Bacteroidota bacterium]
MLNNREDVEDIAPGNIQTVSRNLNSFRFESTFGAWLKRILMEINVSTTCRKRRLTRCSTDELPNKL